MSGWLNRAGSSVVNTVFGQSAAMGALPQLFAATAPDVPGGSYWGPHAGMRGYPAPARPSQAAQDDEVAAALFALTERLTGVSHGLDARR